MSLFEPLFDALNEAGVRYIVVGGVAVVLHGHPRLTIDLDLVVDLAPAQAYAVISVLTSRGMVPVAPVPAADFAEPAKREEWIRDKNMQVFSMIDPANPLLQVDLFATSPIPFESLWERSVLFDVGGTQIRVAGIDDLLGMKRLAGRSQDLADIEVLLAIRDRDKP